MRIKAITPILVSESELARRQDRYRALSPSRVEVELVNLPGRPSVPTKLESASDIRASEELVIEEALRTDPARYDAVPPDCVLDPGLDRLEAESPVSAFGLLKLSARFMVSLGHQFVAFTRNQPIGEELHGRLESYGFLSHFDRVSVLDLAFEDIANGDGWSGALSEAGEQFSGSRTTSVINGCSAVEVRPQSEKAVAVVDPTRLALTLLGAAATEGLASDVASGRASSEPTGSLRS